MTLVAKDLPELSEDVALQAKHQVWLLLIEVKTYGTDARGVWIESGLVIGVTHVACLGHLELGLDLGLTPEIQAQLVAGIMVVVNIALRFVTKEPIA